MEHTLQIEVSRGRNIAATEFGERGNPPVFFLHGGGQSRHAWAGTARAVAGAGYWALAYDHRGHGDSDWHPDGDYGFKGFAEDLIAIVHHFGVRPVLVGASLGGITSVLAETREEGRSICSGIVLVDVTPRLRVAGVARILDFMQAHLHGFASLEEASDHVAAYMPHRERPKDLGGLERNLRLGDDGRYRWRWDPRMMRGGSVDPERVSAAVESAFSVDGDAWGRVRAVSVPLLLVRGRLSDVVDEQDARDLLAAAPHAEYVDVAGAAHMVAGDRNDVFSAAVLDFLGRVVGR